MARQLRGLITRVSAGEIEMVAPIAGDKDDDGRWEYIDLRVIDTNGDESTYRVRSSTPLDQLAALRVAIDGSGTSYLTTPSLDIYTMFVAEDEEAEFDDLYDDLYDEFEEEME
jgi:hypothetical protein